MKRSPIKFSNPMLKRCEFVTNEGFLQQISQAADNPHPVTIRIQPKIEITELSNFQYVASLQTVVGEKSESCPFFADITMQAMFEIGKGVPEDIKQGYLKVNFPAVLYSYIRPILSFLTVNAGLRPYNLPFMDFTDVETNNTKPSQE